MLKMFKGAFGIDSVGGITAVNCPEAAASVPPVNPAYVFQKEHLEDFLAFMVSPGGDGFYITGPAGSGKTSLVVNVCARLGWGLTSITVGNRTEAGDLIGRPSIKNGEVVFQYGALPTAMAAGNVLLINEVDLMPPGELAALNDVLEGRPLCITQNNGEVIEPSPFFRVVCTANSHGTGDGYAGSRVMNVAFLDRFRMIELDYPAERSERVVLKLAAPTLKKATVDGILRFAAELRRRDNTTGEAALDFPVSTRLLSRMARMLEQGLEPLRVMNVCLANKLDKVGREFCQRIWQDIFGNERIPGEAK